MITLRDYQVSNAKTGVEILRNLKILYLAMEVRTGKTLTALEVARLLIETLLS
jgi:superfamily II DNA or RNA helicase